MRYKFHQFIRTDPLISIIIPTHNCGNVLTRALDSIAQQSYLTKELIIIDGGSTDDTLNLVSQFRNLITECVTEPDLGIYDAMNKGVKLAKGDWIYFMGADDILVNCLHKVAKYLRSKKHIYYGDVYLPEKNKVYSGCFKWHTLVSKNINHQSIFYPKQVFAKYKYDLQYPILADYDLNLRIWAERKFYFKYIPVLVALHQPTGVSSHKSDEAFLAEKPQLVARYFGRQIALRRRFLALKKVLRNAVINRDKRA